MLAQLAGIASSTPGPKASEVARPAKAMACAGWIGAKDSTSLARQRAIAPSLDNFKIVRAHSKLLPQLQQVALGVQPPQ